MAVWVETTIATLAWGIAIYKFGAVWRDRQWRGGSLPFYFWGFTVCVAIGMTFMIEDVYLAFDRVVGVTNLAWLVTYAAFALAIFSITSGCFLVLEAPRPRLIPYSLLLTLAILVIVYPIGIATLPEKPDHTIPVTLTEFIFMETLYLYVAALCVIPIATFTRLYRQEAVLPARLRWIVALGTTISSAMVAGLKAILTFLVFWDPETPVLAVAYPMINVVLISASILWPMAFLPNSFYLLLARPIEFLDKVRALRELQALQKKLNRLCPPVIGHTPDLREALDNLDFHLYRAVISILDAKKVLGGIARANDDLSVAPAPDTVLPELPDWDQQDTQLAQSLHQTLQTVNDHVAFPDLVYAYRQVGRAVSTGGMA